MNIEYRFTLDDGATHKFVVDLDREFDATVDRARHAPWTKLAYRQCSNCPLRADQFQHCPVALDLEPIASQFANIISYEAVNVQVNAPERSYFKRCDVQTALRSLIGLVMATSACPILSRLKSLARSHLPFSTVEETLFRTTGAYLLGQYFVYKNGGEADLDLTGLDALYRELQTLNACFKTRIDSASHADANMNALGSLFALSMAVSFSLEDKLEELKEQFFTPKSAGATS